jgi:4-amino-4-deoxy-L-arabinose transferase-like glycosyltransferase
MNSAPTTHAAPIAVADRESSAIMSERAPALIARDASATGTSSVPIVFACASWALLVAIALYARPLLPMDESRYLSIAWEMWCRGEFLVPTLNGQPYAHKGPLLFWLMDAGWWVFGVNDISARLVSPLFGLGSLLLTAHLGRALWPDHAHVRRYAPVVLAGCMSWSLYSTLTYFDTMVTFFTLAAIAGGLAILRGQVLRGWTTLTLAVGIGLLAKGPVLLVHVAPVLLLAPKWLSRGGTTTRSGCALITACLTGLCLAGAWVAVAAERGGEVYAASILVGQTVDRVAGANAHPEPFWWYAVILPCLLFPWLCWTPLLRALRDALRPASNPSITTRELKHLMTEPGTRLCLAWVGAAVGILSLVGGKLPHYLLPELPACALLIARALPAFRLAGRTDHAPLASLLILSGIAAMGLCLLEPQVLPEWVRALPLTAGAMVATAGAGLLLIRPSHPLMAAGMLTGMMTALTFSAHLLAMRAIASAYDLRPMAERIAERERSGMLVGFIGLYHGQYTYLGKLRRVPERVEPGQAEAWLERHPNATLVGAYKGSPPQGLGQPVAAQRFRGHTMIGMWDSEVDRFRIPPAMSMSRQSTPESPSAEASTDLRNASSR